VAFSSSVEESERMYSGTSSVPRISSGSKSRLNEQRGTNCEITNKNKIKDSQKTHSWMVRFLDWLLPSLMACFLLSAMALGFSSSGRGTGCEVIEEYTSGFAEHLSGLFYWLRGVHWEWWLVGVRWWNTKRQDLLSKREGFSQNSVLIPKLKIFCGFLRQGARVFACSAKIEFPNAFKTIKFTFANKEGIITTQTRRLKFHCLLPKSKHP
jgi:hypothetical protein